MTRQGWNAGSISLAGTGSYLPEQITESTTMEKDLKLENGWIVKRTGVRQRRIAAANEACSDLATRAAKEALGSAGVDAQDVGLIVLATSTPDNPLPATACRVQESLHATNAVAFDVDAVCSGFVFATVVAERMMRADDSIHHAVVIGSDVYSRILDYADRRTSVLFGDGAGAVVLSRERRGPILIDSLLRTDGHLHDIVHIAGGGSRRPLTHEAIDAGDQYFRMDGKAVKTYARTHVPSVVTDLLAKTGLDTDDVDLLVPHQANVRLLEELAGHLDLSSVT